MTAPRKALSDRPRVLVIEANEDGTVGGSHQSMLNIMSRVNRDEFQAMACFYQDNDFVERHRMLGWEVQVLTDFRARERRRRLGRPLPLRLFGLARSIMDRARMLREWRVDLVHLNNSPQVGYSEWLPAARLAGVPIVVSARGDADPVRGALRQRLVASFDRYLPVSHYMARALRSQGVEATRITTILNGVDLGELQARLQADDRERIREELGVDPEARFAVMVGNVRHWKGQHVVIEALGRMDPKERPWVVAFAGSEDPDDPSYGDRLRRESRKLGVEDRVRWLGRRTDVPNLFNAADVGLHASVIPEPFGLVLVECLGVGTPVIAAQEGGGGEVVTEAAGWTYPGGDARALARILEVVGRLDQSTLDEVSRSAILRSRAFDADRTAWEVQEVWRRYLPRGSKVPREKALAAAPPRGKGGEA